MQSPIVEGWGEFLSQFWWDWFVTLTFNFDVKTFSAHKRCERWLRELERAAGSPIAWFRGDEYGERLGRFHMHLLIANVAHLQRFAWMKRWERDNGFARIFPFDHAKGAAFYVSKYVVKQSGDYELSDNLNAFRIQQRVLPLTGQRVDAQPVAKIAQPDSPMQRVRTRSVTGQFPLADFRDPVANELERDPVAASFHEQTKLRRHV